MTSVRVIAASDVVQQIVPVCGAMGAEAHATLPNAPCEDGLRQRPETLPWQISLVQTSASSRSSRRAGERGMVSEMSCGRPRVTGIVTDGDLVTRVVAGGLDTRGPISVILSARVIDMDARAMTCQALGEMMTRDVDALPVMGGAEVGGIPCIHDFVLLQEASPLMGKRDIAPGCWRLKRVCLINPRLAGSAC